MAKAFSNFRGSVTGKIDAIWQVVDNRFPFQCDICKRMFDEGGKRFIASSLVMLSHQARGCQCEDCHNGINPFKTKAPKLSERRTSLD